MCGMGNTISTNGKSLSGYGIKQKALNIECIKNHKRKGPAESSLEPLVNGLAAGVVHSGHPRPPEEEIDPQNTAEARVMRLKGYGNAIVAPAAIEFIRAVMADGA